LDLAENYLKTLPENVCKLEKLETLNLEENSFLVSLNLQMLKLSNLKKLNVRYCTALSNPPKEICKEGLPAIWQFYRDLAKSDGQNQPLVTVAIIGAAFAGKTSLIRTLQNPEKVRVLTDRSPDAVVDETTKVFNVEEVEVNNTTLRLVDMGGQEVYHITYQLTLKQNCIPIVVVNMEHYRKQATAFGHREATRRLAFDWLAHLYVANPALGPAKLVLTHKDKFSSNEFTHMREQFLITVNTIRNEIVKEDAIFETKLKRIQHFIDSESVFAAQDVYEIGKNDSYAVYDKLILSIFHSCQKFTRVLPNIWLEIEEVVSTLPSVYSTEDQIISELDKAGKPMLPSELHTILTYMHDSGSLLKYEDIEILRPYIFHKISEVTKLLTVLYHHDDKVWQTRKQMFQLVALPGEQALEKEHFESLIWSYQTTGVMDQQLFCYLIKTETGFKSDVDAQLALSLLQSFRLLYGPLTINSRPCLIVPSFHSEYHQSNFQVKQDIMLQHEILCKGLPVPLYVYHQMTVDILKMFSENTNSVSEKKNGVKLFHDGSFLNFVHDAFSNRIFIQVASAVRKTTQSWSNLIDIVKMISANVVEAWPASRLMHISSCSHCLPVNNPHPARHISPGWCKQNALSEKAVYQKFYSVFTVLCGGDEIPSLFVNPCKL